VPPTLAGLLNPRRHFPRSGPTPKYVRF